MAAEARRTRQGLGSVLVPTDFSRNAARALERVVLLPLAPGARLHIVHVLPRSLPAKLRAGTESEARRALEEAASAVRARARRSGAEGLNVTTGLLSGEPFVEIIRTARTLEAELIVLGRHGWRPLRDLFIGTTAERIVRKGDVPALVVGPRAAQAYSRPLLAIGLDDSSRKVLNVMLRVLGPGVKGATVAHGFNVPFEELISPAHSKGEMSAYRKACRDEASARMKEFLASVSALGLRWRVALRPGDPRSVILKEAVRQRADLLALGTHGRSGISHALLGSVAEWVVAAAPCDVLVVPPGRVSFELP